MCEFIVSKWSNPHNGRFLCVVVQLQWCEPQPEGYGLQLEGYGLQLEGYGLQPVR
jgi:hypothetical protein